MDTNTTRFAIGAALLGVALMLTGAAQALPPPEGGGRAVAAHGEYAPGRARARMRLAMAARRDPAVAVVANLRAIERVYRREQRVDELPALYRDVLARTQDPLVRNFVHYRLARLELRDGDAKAALDALRRNLDENLARLK